MHATWKSWAVPPCHPVSHTGERALIVFSFVHMNLKLGPKPDASDGCGSQSRPVYR